MAELSKQADRLLRGHLRRVSRALRRGGADAAGADLAVAATEEQVHALLEGVAAPVDGPAMQTVLDQIEPPEGWAEEAGTPVGRWLGVSALALTLFTLAALMFTSVFSHEIGGDGGQISYTIALYGFVPALILGVLGRHHPAGRVARLISGLFVGWFALVLVVFSIAAALG